MQELNRAKVLAAALEVFTEYGFRSAKIDTIAERAGLTRGAVYSNFPGKRALYFAVLASLAAHAPAEPPSPGLSAAEALGVFARAWVTRLPMTETDRLAVDVMQEIVSDERTRRPYTQLTSLNALLLGLALEQLSPSPGRRVRVATAALTTLQGAAQLAAAAPGFVEPFDVVRACEHLASLDLGDDWPPPLWAPYVPLARPDDAPWTVPAADDVVSGLAADLAADGVVAILGLHRLEAVEEAVRAVPPGSVVTAVLVTGDPAELAPLAQLALNEVLGCLRQAFPPAAWPRLRVVADPSGAVAAAAGITAVSDGTEAAVRIEGGRVVARADGRGACYATATSALPRTAFPS